jgi:hypothetical protein
VFRRVALGQSDYGQCVGTYLAHAFPASPFAVRCCGFVLTWTPTYAPVPDALDPEHELNATATR